jgi:hypothetical protein
MGGIRKTTLAIALRHDPSVQTEFRDSILWATLGREADTASIVSAQLAWGHALGENLAVLPGVPQHELAGCDRCSMIAVA